MPKGGPSVLHGLTFEVKSGERVGVGEYLFQLSQIIGIWLIADSVGRTGSGKVCQEHRHTLNSP